LSNTNITLGNCCLGFPFSDWAACALLASKENKTCRAEASFNLYNDDNRLRLEPLSQDRIRCYALAVSDDRQKAELRLLF